MNLAVVLQHFSRLIYDPKALGRELVGRGRLLFVPTAGQGIKDLRGVKFTCHWGRDRAFRRMYAGCYQPDIVGVLERYLRPGDVFLDVGANVGFITAYAAGLVGGPGQVYAFEPVPKYFAQLQAVVADNPGRQIHLQPAACGDTEGMLDMAVDADNMGGSSAVPNRVAHAEQRLQVPLIVLDRYLEAHAVRPIRLIKIDVEGFEYFVLNGLRQTLQSQRPIVVCEIAPSAYSATRLGFDLGRLSRLFEEIQYAPYHLSPFRVRFDLARIGPAATDVLLLPLETSPVHGQVAHV